MHCYALRLFSRFQRGRDDGEGAEERYGREPGKGLQSGLKPLELSIDSGHVPEVMHRRVQCWAHREIVLLIYHSRKGR